MHIGVTAWYLGNRLTASSLAEQAAFAESIGFQSFWLPESHFISEGAVPCPLLLLAAAAAGTQRIQLGVSSYLIPVRNPLLAAEEVAVLDQLCQGRLLLGLGRGFQDSLFTALQVEKKEKRKLFADNLAIMQAAWNGEVIAKAEDGSNIYLSPLPVQRPSPPLWIAAFGPLAIRQAASYGLPYLASPVEPLHRLASNYALYEAALEEAGHPLPDTRPVMRTLYVSKHPHLQKRVRELLLATDAGKQHQTLDDWAIVGDASYVSDQLQALSEHLGVTHLIARGRLPQLDSDTQKLALTELAGLCNQFRQGQDS